MQSIDHLTNKIAIKISELKSTKRTLYFSKIDLKYSYSQLPLHTAHKNTVILTYQSGIQLEHIDSSMASAA